MSVSASTSDGEHPATPFPMLLVAVWYAIGLVCGYLIELPWRWCLGITTALWLAVVACLCRRSCNGLLAVLLFAAGATHVTLRTAAVSPHDLRHVLGEKSQVAQLRGTLSAEPLLRQLSTNASIPLRSVVYLDVEAIRQRNQRWQPAAGRVAVTFPGDLSAYHKGERIELSGAVGPPGPPRAEGLFDYRAHLRARGVHYLVRCLPSDTWRRLGQAKTPPWWVRWRGWARSCLARGLSADDPELPLIWAMVLGWRTGLNNDVAEPFMHSGSMHIFAISGLHVGMITSILFILLRAVRVPRTIASLTVIPLVWFYTLATGAMPSAVRASVMVTIILLGWALKRPTDLINSLAAAAFVILLWEPLELFQTGFQLSFAVVLTLALFAPKWEAWRKRFLQPDPFLPAQLRPFWRRSLDQPLRFGVGLCLTSLAAWLGSMPLIAHYFHLLTPVTILTNLVLIPMAYGALASALGSLFTGAWWASGAELFNNSAWLFMKGMHWVSVTSAECPAAWFHIGTPSVPVTALYYLLLLAGSRGLWQDPRWRKPIAMTAAALAIAWGWTAWRAPAARLTVLPLRGGHAVYADLGRWSANWLIDCGDETAVELTTYPFLRAHGVNVIHRLVLTHGDSRHAAGAPTLENWFYLRQLVVSPIQFRSKAYSQFVRQWQQSKRAVRTAVASTLLGPWEVLHPLPEDDYDRADDAALVLRGRIGSARVLLLSDLGRLGQRDLFLRQHDLQADIVIAGLPDKDEPLPNAWLEKIQPALIVIADDQVPSTAQAPAKLRRRLAQCGVPVLYTRETGAITFEFIRRGWRFRGMNGMHGAFTDGRLNVAGPGLSAQTRTGPSG